MRSLVSSCYPAHNSAATQAAPGPRTRRRARPPRLRPGGRLRTPGVRTAPPEDAHPVGMVAAAPPPGQDRPNKIIPAARS
ncbi:hypothetical protein FM076_12710 [Streptomyces albus subsp. chlorinus]|nr:hypothetical protein [Streptomyces albus subsp. chlorinus]